MAQSDTYITQTGQIKPKTPKPTAFEKQLSRPIKDVISPAKEVGGHQRVSHQDGHQVNESYKIPSPHPSGRENLSYMHPHVEPLSLTAAWKTADKALGESNRPASQLGRSKTVFPVTQDKARGAPKPPAYARATRAQSHSPAPGVIPGPAKPTIF